MMKSTTVVTPPHVILQFYFRNLVQQDNESLMPSVMDVSHSRLFNRYRFKYMETVYKELTRAAAAAAKSLQSCPTLCDPIDGSPPGSQSLGFSRQEHWSGLPFPSPMHESQKRKRSYSVVSDSQRPHGLQPTRLHCPWDFPGKSTGVDCHCLLWSIQLIFLISDIARIPHFAKVGKKEQ